MLHPTFFADAKTPNSPDVRHEFVAYVVLVAFVPGAWYKWKFILEVSTSLHESLS
jgi:hypothetical protein